MFKEHNKHRFRFFKPKSNCHKLLDENNVTTSNPPTILKLFQSYFTKLALSNVDTFTNKAGMDELEASSFTHNDQIVDTDITVEEIEIAIKALKVGRSKGADGLNSEHLIYGGPSIPLWLKKIF